MFDLGPVPAAAEDVQLAVVDELEQVVGVGERDDLVVAAVDDQGAVGPGPRDGLMTGLAELTIAGRPISVRLARTVVEVSALAVGVALGGAIGVGTAVFAIGVGPLVQVFLPPLTMPKPGVDSTPPPAPAVLDGP